MQNSHFMPEIILKIRYFETGWPKDLKKVNFIVSPIPHNGKDYETQKGLETSDKLFFKLQNKCRKIPLLKM